MSIAFVELGTHSGNTSPLEFPTSNLSSLAENQVAVAVVKCAKLGEIPTITAPSGWEEIGQAPTGSNAAVAIFVHRVTDSEPSTWDFAWDASGTYTCYVKIATYSGCATTGDLYADYSDDAYTVDDTTLRAGAVTATAMNVLVAAGAFVTGTVSPPSGWTERVDANQCMIADKAVDAGDTGNIDFTLSSATSYKHCVLVALRPVPEPPNTPVVSTPSDDDEIVPGETVNLTATATDPEGDDVLYRWKYAKDGGADVAIGDTSPAVSSGTPDTYEWDTSGLEPGSYVLKCWAVDDNGFETPAYDSVTVALRHVEITAPVDESSTVSGTVIFTGRGYLTTAGDVALRWEVDTNETPDSGADDYQTFDSVYGDQGESLSMGLSLEKGTWYFRACTLDTDTPVNTSDWSPTYTLYVLEEIRLLSGDAVKSTILNVANKIYARVKGTAIVETATYDEEGDPLRYSASPREDLVILPEGDSTAAAAVASSTLTRRREEQENYSGLQVSLVDGMKLERGVNVGVQIERADINATLPIRQLHFDLSSGVCSVIVGEWDAPKSDVDTLIGVAQDVDNLKRES